MQALKDFNSHLPKAYNSWRYANKINIHVYIKVNEEIIPWDVKLDIFKQ